MISMRFYFGNHLAADWLASRLAAVVGGATTIDTLGLWYDKKLALLQREPGAVVEVIGSPDDSQLEAWKSLAEDAAKRYGEEEVLWTITHLIDSGTVLAENSYTRRTN